MVSPDYILGVVTGVCFTTLAIVLIVLYAESTMNLDEIWNNRLRRLKNDR